MIVLGIVAILYAVASYALPKIGYQLVLLQWMHGMSGGAQWGIRGALVALGLTLIVLGLRRRARG